MAKRKENGLGSIRKRKDGTWEGRFSAGGRRFSVYGKTQSEVRRKLTEAQASVDRSEFIKPDKITVREWATIWQRDYLPDVKPSTRSSYEGFIRCHIVPGIGSIALQKLSGPMIQSFLTQAQKAHKIKMEDGSTLDCRGLSAASVKSLRNVLSRCLSQAVKCGYLSRNPCESTVLPTIPKREMHTIEDVKKFLDCISGDPFENLFIVAIFSGMRQGELIGLTWDCIDFGKGLISVSKQYRRVPCKNAGDFEFSSTKNGKARLICPAQFVMDALKREQKKQNTNKLKHGPAYSNKEGFVFTNELGEHLKPSTLRDHLKRILTTNGLENVRFHDLRHSFATLSIQNGDDIKTVSETLGHSTAAFTMDVYGHVTEAMRKRSGERMQAYIDSVKGVG